MCTQSCTQDPRVYLLAVVKSDTNAEGESFVGLHTLTCRARQLGKRHISALGNAHYNDYMGSNVKFVTSDTCFFQTRALRGSIYSVRIAIEPLDHCAGGPFSSTMLP